MGSVLSLVSFISVLNGDSVACLEVVEVYVWVDHLWIGGLRVASWLFIDALWPSGVTSGQLGNGAEESNIPSISVTRQECNIGTYSLGILPSYRQSQDASWLRVGAIGAHFSKASPGPLPYPPHCSIVRFKVDGTH
jgi:hypothetical protein